MKRLISISMAGVLSLSFALLLFAGCSASSNKSSHSAASGAYTSSSYTGETYDLNTAVTGSGDYSLKEGSAVAPGMDGGSETIAMPEAPAASGLANAVSASERKIIKNAYYSIETTSYAEDFAKLNAKITEFSGYIQSSNSSGNAENDSARSNLTARIPADKYEAFKAAVSSDFYITSSGENGDDVTSQYIDTETRLKVLSAQEERVLELLEKAQTIEDIISIEDKLTQIRAEIESLTTTVKRLQELTSYATVNIDMVQTTSLSPVKGNSFWDNVLQGLENTANSLVSIAIWLISILPYLIILFIIYLIVCRIIKKHKANKAAVTTQVLPVETVQAEEKAENKPEDK